MKLLKSKKGIAFSATVVFAFAAVAIVLFGGASVVKLMFTDKTPFIIGGIFLILILFGKNKQRG